MVATIESGVDKLCDGFPGRTGHTVTDFRIGDPQLVELGTNTFESLVQSSEIDMLTIRTRVNNGSFNGNETMAVRSGLTRTQTNVSKLCSFCHNGVDNKVAFATSSPLVQVTFDNFHRRHGGRRKSDDELVVRVEKKELKGVGSKGRYDDISLRK